MQEKKELIGIKRVGMNGQISIGKKYAGRQMQLFKIDDGTLLLQAGKFVPDERELDEFIAWADSTERRDNYDEIKSLIERKIRGE